MRVDVGKEIKTAKHRLSDIIFFCQRTEPTEGATWEEYTKELKRLVMKSANEAARLLNIVEDK